VTGSSKLAAGGPLMIGIESSCDETGVGIVRGRDLLANEVASSVELHVRFGGVVPEVASRAHLEAMVPTLQRACASAEIDLSEISDRSPEPQSPSGEIGSSETETYSWLKGRHPATPRRRAATAPRHRAATWRGPPPEARRPAAAWSRPP